MIFLRRLQSRHQNWMSTDFVLVHFKSFIRWFMHYHMHSKCSYNLWLHVFVKNAGWALVRFVNRPCIHLTMFNSILMKEVNWPLHIPWRKNYLLCCCGLWNKLFDIDWPRLELSVALDGCPVCTENFICTRSATTVEQRA